MKPGDLFRFASTSLWKARLRTFLTMFGVTVGIGALSCLIAFGSGMQKNVSDQFMKLDLFNALTILPGKADSKKAVLLDDGIKEELSRQKGVESVYPDIRIPARISRGEKKEMNLIQAIPAAIAASPMYPVAFGRPYRSDDEAGIMAGPALLRRLGFKDPSRALGKKLQIAVIQFDLAALNPMNAASTIGKGKLPLRDETFRLPVVGVTEESAFTGGIMRPEVLIPSGFAKRMKHIPFTNLWELFRMDKGRVGYSALNVRVRDPRFVQPVADKAREMGLETYSLMDQFKEMRVGFLIMDMVLAAIGMVAIFVAGLGIINTMVMSILERTREIGIMKAVGASDRDVKSVFFIECLVIGIGGGISGLLLGMGVSRVINQIVNHFLAKQGVPFVNYFHFSWLLAGGAILFSLLISLAAGIYPASRAARIDPVRALRRE